MKWRVLLWTCRTRRRLGLPVGVSNLSLLGCISVLSLVPCDGFPVMFSMVMLRMLRLLSVLSVLVIRFCLLLTSSRLGSVLFLLSVCWKCSLTVRCTVLQLLLGVMLATPQCWHRVPIGFVGLKMM